MLNNYFNRNMPQPNNPMNMMQRFNQFCQQFQQQGKNPQEIVQQLLNSGQMTQAQFEQFRQTANNLLGTKF